jgi:hypothetical protein
LPAEWRRFVALMEALPAEQAAPLWQAAQAQMMKALSARRIYVCKSCRTYRSDEGCGK